MSKMKKGVEHTGHDVKKGAEYAGHDVKALNMLDMM